jgi:hypothetical protein
MCSRSGFWSRSDALERSIIWTDFDVIFSVQLLQVQVGFKGDHARKMNQFAIVFHLLQNGHPMLEYESLKELFTFLKMPNLNKKHWGDTLAS